jgi:hypothetical protein
MNSKLCWSSHVTISSMVLKNMEKLKINSSMLLVTCMWGTCTQLQQASFVQTCCIVASSSVETVGGVDYTKYM